jgi:putative phosphoribosyl transferase
MMRWIRWFNRVDAGVALGKKLAQYADRSDVIVLGLPRGGVPVAAAVADALHAPLDVFLVRKLGVPGHEEFAFGALASDGAIVLNRQAVDTLGLGPAQIQQVVADEEQELVRREQAYRDDRPFPSIKGKTVIIVDDGLATGSTMYAAVVALTELTPTRIVVAAPVASPEAIESLRSVADSVVVLAAPDPFLAVGAWYEHFDQVSDDEVRALLTGRMAP